MFRRILVPTDFSPAAGEALRIARQGFLDAEICLLHVLEPKHLASALNSPVHSSDEAKAYGERLLERLNLLAQAGEETLVEIGSPAETVLARAAAWQADLIVMGTHGRTGLAHLLMGSVAENVVRRATLPVLIAHEPGPD